MPESAPLLLANDAVLFGVLALILGFVFWTSESTNSFWKGFYRIFPPLLLAYFLPSMLTTFGLVDPEESQLYFVASRYLMPTALVLRRSAGDSSRRWARPGPTQRPSRRTTRPTNST
jgi:hypothetical protein